MQRISWYELNNRTKIHKLCTKPKEMSMSLTQKICKTTQNAIKYEKDYHVL